MSQNLHSNRKKTGNSKLIIKFSWTFSQALNFIGLPWKGKLALNGCMLVGILIISHKPDKGPGRDINMQPGEEDCGAVSRPSSQALIKMLQCGP